MINSNIIVVEIEAPHLKVQHFKVALLLRLPTQHLVAISVRAAGSSLTETILQSDGWSVFHGTRVVATDDQSCLVALLVSVVVAGDGEHFQVFTVFESKDERITRSKELIRINRGILALPSLRTKPAKDKAFRVFQHYERRIAPLQSVVKG